MNTLSAKFPASAAVIGSGSIGEKHLINIKATYPDCSLISAPSRFKPGYSNPVANICCDSAEEVVKLNPDIAIIASPATKHLEHAKLFDGSKTSLLIEKPLTSSNELSRALQEFVSTSNIHAKLGYCLRQLPSVQFVKEQLLKGAIGRVISVSAKVAQYLPHWRPGIDYHDSVSAQKKLGGGVLLELSHELDLVNYLFGETECLSSVLINSGQLGVDVEEIAHLTLNTVHKAIISLELNFLQQDTERYMVINGEHGTLRCNWLTNEVKLISNKGNKVFTPQDGWANSNIYQQQLVQFVQGIETGYCNLPSIYEGGVINRLIDEIRAKAVVIEGVER